MIEKNIRLQPHHSRDLLVGRRSDGKRPGYQPPGRGGRSGGPPSQGGGAPSRSAPSRPTPSPHRDPAPAPSPDRQDRARQQAAVEQRAEAHRQEANRANQLAEARKLMTQPTTVDVPIKGPELIPGTTGPFVADPYQQNYISPGEVYFKDRYQTGDYDDLVQGPVDVGFQEALRKQQIAEDLRQKQQDPDYGQFFRPQPVVEQSSGIMGTAKDKATQMAKDFATRKAMKALGLGAFNPFLGVGSWLLDKFAPGAKAKFTNKFKYTGPKTDTQEKATKKLVKHDPVDRDEKQITGGENVVSENIKKFTGTTDEQAEFMKRRNMVQGILDQGSYQGKELTEQQRNSLLNYIEQISKFIVDPMEVADGGRIDKPLTGRSRDI